jgi:hypothetical protein
MKNTIEKVFKTEFVQKCENFIYFLDLIHLVFIDKK